MQVMVGLVIVWVMLSELPKKFAYFVIRTVAAAIAASYCLMLLKLSAWVPPGKLARAGLHHVTNVRRQR